MTTTILLGGLAVFSFVFIWFCLDYHSLRVSRSNSESRLEALNEVDIEIKLRLDTQELLLKRAQKKLDTLLPDWRDDRMLTDIWDHDDQRPISEASERIPSKGNYRRS